VIEASGVPTRATPVQFGDREVVDLMREAVIGREAERLLQLGQDHAEMGDGDDIAVRMGGQQAANGGVDTCGNLMPAFAIWGAFVTGIFPIAAGVGLIFDLVKAFEFPIAKVDFAQVGVMRQAGARAGDRIFVSGTIGDGAMGLKSLTDNLAGLGEKDRSYLERRYRLPEPRISLGRQLLGLATAAIDVSDGLVGDLEHICSASGVGATVELTRVPMSPAVQAAVEGDPKLAEIAIAGGDDYELLFTAPVDKRTAIEAAVRDSGVPVTEIGTVETGQEVVILGPNGNPLALKHHGYSHF